MQRPVSSQTAMLMGKGLPRARGPFHVLAKPAGAICNLDCEYCFYLAKSEMFPGSDFRMSDEVLEAYVRGYIESQPPDCPEVNFAWQGGEPTLMGIDFFERAVELQEKYRRPSMRITNALQTNGTRLDEAWCRFLRANEFLVGISIDGPRRFHDHYRKTKGGEGSFDQVKRGLDHLVAAGVEFNVLTVVQRHNGDHPIEVYEGLKALGAEFIQFIPIVERTGPYSVSERSVLPHQFGRFMIRVFERWRTGDIGRVFVQHFDMALGAVVGGQPTLCVHAPRCGRSVAIEHNGDVFSCDHFVSDDFRLGNIRREDFVELVDGPAQTAFGAAKEMRLPVRCLACPVRYLCNGGCPAQFMGEATESRATTSYLCDGYFAFFRHIEPYLVAMKSALERGLPAEMYARFLPATERKPARNDPCPCGSGRKHKHCCGR